MADFDDFDTQAQCEEYFNDDAFSIDDLAELCVAQLGGTCTGCGECAIEDCADTNPATGEQVYA